MTRQFYNKLFRDLFPDEWRAFMNARHSDRTPLVEIFAEDETELINVMQDSPPIDEFCELMERYYFPVPDFWIEADMVANEEGEMDDFLFCEIPVNPFFEDYDLSGDPHNIWPVFQVLKTLDGSIRKHEEAINCSGRCELRALEVLACNEMGRINVPHLERICRKESSPLKHMPLALKIMEKSAGNVWFDMDYEMYSETGISWSRKNVQAVAREWKRANEDMVKLNELDDYFRKRMLRVREASSLWRKAAVL